MSDFTYRAISLDSYFDKIFYINLRHDVDRDLAMLAQFKKFNITNFERIDAYSVDPPHLFEEYRNFIKGDSKYVSGQISCRKSHVECIKLAKSRGYSNVLILEDDMLILQDPNQLLTQNQEILNSWDLLYFGGLIEPFFRNQIVCAHVYAVKHTVFDDIIYMAEISGMEIDNFYAKILQHMSYNYNQSGKYNIRIILPFNQIVQNKSFPSNIQTDTT